MTRTSVSRSATLIQQDQEGVLVAYRNSGEIISANRRSATLLNIDSSLLINRPLSDFIQREQIAQLRSPSGNSAVYLDMPDGTAIQLKYDHSASSDEKDVFLLNAIPFQSLRDYQLFERYVELTNVLLLEFTLEGHVVNANRACEKLLQWPAHEIIGKKWVEVFTPPEERAQILAYKSVLESMGDKPLQHKTNVLCRDGSRRLVDFRFTVVKDARGLITGIIASGEDITEKIALQRLLQKTEREYEYLFEKLNDGVLQLDQGGRVVLVNPAFCKMTGYEAGDIIGHELLEFVKIKATRNFIETQGSRRHRGKSAVAEVAFERKDGVPGWAKVSIAPVDDQDGVNLGSIAILTDISTEKKAKLAYEREEKLNSFILSSIPDSILLTDRHGIIRYAHLHQGLTEIKDPLIGGRIQDVFPGQNGIKFFEVIKKVISGRSSGSFEFTVNGEFGTSFFEARVVAQDTQLAMAIIRDTTAEKQARIELQENEHRHATLLSALRDCIIRATIEGICVDYKPFQGEAAENATINRGKSLSEFLPANEAELHRHYIKLSIETKQYLQYQIERRDPTGRLQYLEARTVAGSDDEGIIFLRDITERRLAEEELKNSRTLYGRAERIANLGSWEYDVRTKTARYSEQFYRIYGYEPYQITLDPESMYDHTVGEDRDRVRQEISTALAMKRDFEVFHKIIHRTGKIIEIVSIGRVDCDEHGEIIRVSGIIQDVSTHKKLERDLQERNTELSTFIYRTSHNLRSPLTSALGLLNLAKKEQKSQGEYPYLETIESLILRLDHILMELINVVMIKGGELKPEMIDPASLVKEIIGEYEFNDSAKDIDFITDLPGPATKSTDKQLLRAIITNLVENAVKYRRVGSQKSFVRVSLKYRPDYLQVKVSDNGAGIPESALPKVFDMFFRANDHVKGTGMGLYIVKNAIDKLDGVIDIESSPDKGTVIQFRIPYLDLKEPADNGRK